MNGCHFSGHLKPSLEERFWARVNKHGPKQPHAKTRCWVWTGQINRRRGGYGVFNGKRVPEWAHRAAWRFRYGPIPKGIMVLHECDHPPCVRHLFLGTSADNMRDMIRKDRECRGARSRSVKLKDRDVVQVRALLRKGRTQRIIAGIFQVNQSTISDIANRITWRKVG
jgi:hypothetical protein